MHNTDNDKRPPVAQLYPPEIRDALVSAAERRDHLMVDRLTDELAKRGFVRPRHADDTPAVNRWELRA